MKEQYLRNFFGKQTDYYQDEYSFINSGRVFSFNVGTFFGGFLWLLYRKLYWQTAALLIVFYGIELIERYVFGKFSFPVEAQKAFMLLTNLFVVVLIGFLGNFVYIKHADRKIKKILENYPDENQRLEQMAKQGGVSLISLFMAIVASGCLTWLSVAAPNRI